MFLYTMEAAFSFFVGDDMKVAKFVGVANLTIQRTGRAVVFGLGQQEEAADQCDAQGYDEKPIVPSKQESACPKIVSRYEPPATTSGDV